MHEAIETEIPRRSTVRRYLLTWLALPALAVASDPARAAEGANPSVFTVHTADGSDHRGSLRELMADWSLRVGDGGEGTRIAGADVVSARQRGVALPPMPVGEHVVLANGDRLPIGQVRLDGEKLRCRCADFGGAEVELPLGTVAVWWRTAPDGVAAADRFLRSLLSKDRKRDTIYLRNGDVLEGVLEALDDKRMSLEVEKKSVVTDLARVAALAVGTEPAPGLRPKGLHARLTLDSGARLTLASVECHDGLTLQGTAAFGAPLRVPLGRVVAIDWLGGRTVYLSDMKPAGFDEPLPYLGVDSIHWPPVADGSVDERDLRLGGSTYTKGVGLHSPGRVRYALGGAYRRFEALVGLDDKTGRRGSVRVLVLGDGRPLAIGFAGELTSKNGPFKLQADVTGVKELTLEVDVGRGGNVQDHVDWADARVIK
jgi:sRNA-binding regulator protein Hfq